MKAIPILVVTNALALALAIYLFVEQSALRSQLGARRSETVRTEFADPGDVQVRLDRLERGYAARGEALPPLEDAPSAGNAAPSRSATPDEPFASPGPRGAAAPDDAPAAPASEEYDPRELEVFRKKVRRANELNDEEDQLNRVAERLDTLVSENRIAPLDAGQRTALARLSLDYRRRVPDVWRKVRETLPETASREDRGRVMRAEFEALRAQAQREMELIVSAADAKTIMDESMRERGFGGGPDGPGPRGAPGR
jgi:hypothetical protein